MPRSIPLKLSPLALGLVAATASAQGGRTTLDAYSPAPRVRDGFAVSSAEVDGHRAMSGMLVLDYANDPLVYETNQGTADSETRQVVAHHFVAHAVFTASFVDRLQLHLVLPIDFVQRGDSGLAAGVARADGGVGLGNARVGGRVHILGDERFGLGADLTLGVPTASAVDGNQHYRGDDGITGTATVLGHVDVGIVRVALNLGAHFREDQRFLGVTRGDEFTYGVGAQVRLRDDSVVVSAELFGATAWRNFADREASPLEGLLGAKYFPGRGFFVGGALDAGFVRGFGSPDFRMLLSVGHSCASCDRCDHEHAPAAEPVDGDSDGDGLLDSADRCPTEPEDADGFEDDDGCVDPDDDRDGVLDVVDAAPRDPEDIDGFEDADGAPDPDNDGDGVPDASDRCPLAPGPVEEGGCQPPDRDGDTVVDRVDNCPDEPGTPEFQGCRAAQQVAIQGDTLVIVDNVYFRTNRDVIERRSFALLDNVAAVISAHPEIVAVRVEGHTDARGNRDRNVALSLARARSVVQYLVRRGVAEGRLRAAGFGPDRPVVPNATTPDEHARNRRVEFHIEGADIETRDSGPTGETIDR